MNLLVRKARRHDKDAFVKLMEQNGESMYKVAKAILKNDEDAADAMQETTLVCWEKIGMLREDRFFKTWMMRILINQCNAIYRQKRRTIPQDELPEGTDSTDEYENVEWQMMLDILDKKYRTVIVLYYVEGFKIKEIASILETTESTVKNRLAAARKQMEGIYGIKRGLGTI